MTLVSSCAHALNLSPMDEDMLPHAHSMRSGSSSRLSFSLREIQEAMVGIQEEKSKVYVMVGTKQVQEWIDNMKWLLKNIDKDLTAIVFLHVHQPAQRIATPIGYIPANGLEQQELIAYRQLEKEKMNKCLKKYVDICVKNNFNAIAFSTDSDDIVKGLLELIRQYNITDLVMGAGSAKGFSILPYLKANRTNKPNSRIANALREKAERSCRIRFISRGELICIREPHQNALDASTFSRSSSSSSSDHSTQLQLRSHSMPPSQTQSKQTIGPSGLDQKSRSAINVVSGASFLNGSLHPSSYSGFENLYGQSSRSLLSQNLVSEVDACYLISDSLPEDVYTRLEEAMTEAEKHKQEAYEESTRRSKAELDLFQAKKQIRTLENSLNVEMQKKSEIEGTLARQSIELEKTRKLYEQALNELSSLELQNMQLRQTVASLQLKIEETSENAQERDVALRTTQEFGRHSSRSRHLVKCPEFTYAEIKEATKNFDPSSKIGEGGFGAVYMGFLRHTRVAIKIMNRASAQGDPQFCQEIEILSQIRHPHLVMLIGACFKARALVYEYLALGSLDKHLTYNGQNRPLPWQIRARIALEICSALIFLHSSHVVHGDLKPENILLDSNCMVKLSDMGICRQVHMTNTTSTPYHITDQPRGTFPYMDPEYLSSGELTPQYDVYSFGIVLLQLVTGKEAKRLKNDMEEAIERQRIERMVDAAAGWPLEEAMKMIQVGMCCSDASRRKRPDLAKDVWRLLESIASVASASLSQRRPLTKTA